MIRIGKKSAGTLGIIGAFVGLVIGLLLGNYGLMVILAIALGIVGFLWGKKK